MMCEEEARLPTGIWMEAHLRRLNGEGVSYYIVNKGAYASGTVLVKIIGSNDECVLMSQQRDMDGNLGWMHVLGQETVEETDADSYIRRSITRDPDVWIIEIEDKSMTNPFEGKIV